MHERGVPKTPASRRGCDFCRQIGPMEIIFVLAALLLSSIAILILLLLAAGLACIFGASFALVFRGGLWLLLLPPLCILYGWLAGRERFVVKETDIVSAEVPEGFDGFRMVQISDLHLRSFRGRRKSLERVVDKINAQRPDIVVFTGDIVTSHPDEIAPLAEILGRIASPVYSVMGNHDYCPYNRWDSAEEQSEAVREVREWEARLGWTLLDEGGTAVGQITGYMDIPGNPCLEVRPGQEAGDGAGEIIIPLHEDLVLSIDEEKRELTMSIPAGLL